MDYYNSMSEESEKEKERIREMEEYEKKMIGF